MNSHIRYILIVFVCFALFLPSYSRALDTYEYYKGDVGKYPSPTPTKKIKVKEKIPVDDLSAAGQRLTDRPFSNRSAKVGLLGLRGLSSIDGRLAREGRRFILLETVWENIHPRQKVDKRKLEGKADRTMGAGGLFSGKATGGKGSRDYIEQDVAYKVPRWGDHVVLLADGIAYPLDGRSGRVKDGADPQGGMVIPRFHATKHVRFTFQVPKMGKNMALHFFDYDSGHITIPLTGNLDKAKGQPALKPTIQTFSTDKLDGAILGSGAVSQFRGTKPPTGWQFREVRLLGASKSSRGGRGDIVQLDPGKDIWLQDREGFLYSPLPPEGTFLRFFPLYLTEQHLVFLFPEGAVQAKCIIRAGSKTFSIPLGKVNITLPAQVKSFKDGSVAKISILGKRTDGGNTIIDINALNLLKEKGLELSPASQFQMKRGGKKKPPDSGLTGAMAHGAKRVTVVPPGGSARFLLAFRGAADGATLIYRGIKSENEVPLSAIPPTKMTAAALKAPHMPAFSTEKAGKTAMGSAPSRPLKGKSGMKKGEAKAIKESVKTVVPPSSIDLSRAAKEIEPNNEPGKATPLEQEHDYTVKGVLEPGNDDYFALQVEGTPKLWNMKAKGATIRYVAYLDSSGRDMITRQPSRKDSSSEIQNLYLLPGRHLFKIRAPRRGKRGEYIFWLKPLSAPDPLGEREPNDDATRAQKVMIGQAMHGTLTNGDYDYYRFSFSTSSYVRITLTPSPGESVRMNMRGNEVASIMSGYSRKAGEVVKKEGVLPPEDYVMDIRGSGAYTLLVEQFPPLLEKNRDYKGKIEIETPPGPITVASFWHQGQRILAKVHLKNGSSSARNLEFHTWSSGEGWKITAEKDEVTLLPGAELELPLKIEAPADIPTGEPVGVWIIATDKTGGGAGHLTIDPECGAEPINPVDDWPVPASMLGGLDLAWSSLGGRVPGAGKNDRRWALFNGVTPNDQEWHTYAKSFGKSAPEITVKLAGEGKIPVTGVILNPMGCNTSGNIPQKFEILLSGDGKSFTSALKGNMNRRPVDQPFPINSSKPAKFAKLRILSTQGGGKRVCLGEWKVVGKPGVSPWSGEGPNIADPDLGGHMVRSSPLIKAHQGMSMLTGSKEGPVTRFEIGRTNEWVIGFHHNRVAMITGVQWVRNTKKDSYGRIRSVHLFSSLESPLGPWKPLGSLKIEGSELTTFKLPSPEWARFIRFSVAGLDKSGTYHLPETLRVIEKKAGEDYISILGEWGHYGNSSYFEFSKAGEGALGKGETSPSSGTKGKPLPLKMGTTLWGSVEIGKDEDWYLVNVGKGQNSITITLAGEPALKARPSLYDSGGKEVPLTEYSTSGAKSRFTARTAPGKYRLKVFEPPRNIAMVWDQSGSVTSFVPNIYRTLAAFSQGITPKREFANFLPFQDKNPSFILDEWNDQPLVLLHALNDYDRKASSSNAELNLLKAVRELGKQEGSRAVVLLTDADSGGYGKSEELWLSMEKVKPRIFSVELHRGLDQSSKHQDLMQDWAMAGSGHYSFFRSQSDLDVALGRAVCYLRRPATYSVKTETTYVKPPEPGSIEVKGKSLPGNAIELILDASGSMYKKLKGGKTRISVAKSVMTKLVKEVIPQGTPVALRVYGHREAKSCRTDLEVPLKPLDPVQMSGTIAKIDPKNRSKTPLAASIAKVAQDLKGAKGEKVVILVTDGEESCDGDPQETIQSLKETGLDVRLSIVGFAIEDKVLIDAFSSWASIGGGSYFNASDAKELSKALDQALRPKFNVIDGKGTVVARGITGGKAVSVKAGTYKIRILTSPVKTLDGIVVEAGEKVTLK